MRHPLAVSSFLLFAAFASAPPVAAQEPVPAASKGVRSAADAAWAAKDWERAAANYRAVTAAEAKDGEAWHRLGYALHALGKLDEALAAHEKAATFPRFAAHGCYNAACVHALKGDEEQAFAWLDKAAAAGLDLADHIVEDGDLASLRDDPRFAAVVAKVQKNAAAAAGRMTVYQQDTDRRRNRVAWFTRTSLPAQVSIEYAAVPWLPEYEAKVSAEENFGKKWRLGADFWTTLDSSAAMRLGGVDVPAGYYYLTLEQRDADTFVLALHDPAAVKRQRVDAWQAGKLQGGIEVPMRRAALASAAAKLAIALEIAKETQDRGTLCIRFGGHELAAVAEVALPK